MRESHVFASIEDDIVADADERTARRAVIDDVIVAVERIDQFVGAEIGIDAVVLDR